MADSARLLFFAGSTRDGSINRKRAVAAHAMAAERQRKMLEATIDRLAQTARRLYS